MAALETSDVTTVPPEVEGDGEDGVLGRAYRALSIGIVSVVLVIAFEATAVGTAMPVAARELDGVALYAFAFSGYFTTSLFGMVLAGQWSDRDGPLASLTVGIGAFAGGLLLSGTAGGMWLFVLGRAVQGLGGGLVIVALYVVVGRAYPERLRPAIMAAFAAAWVVPSVVGPLAAGAVTEHLGWRWVFLGIPALVGIPLALALPQIRRRAGGPATDGEPADTPIAGGTGSDGFARTGTGSDGLARVGTGSDGVARTGTGSDEATRPGTDGFTGTHPFGHAPGDASPDPLTPDPLGAGPLDRAPLAVEALAAETLSPESLRRAPLDRRRIRLAFGIAFGAGLLQYAAQDLRPLSLLPALAGVALLVPAVRGLLPHGTWRAARGLPSVVLLRGVAAGSFVAAESFVPLMLVTQRGLSPTLAGLSLAAGGATWALGSWLQARPGVEPYRERLMFLGMLLVAAAVATAPSVLLPAVPVWTVAVAWAFGCFGMGLVVASTSVLLLQLSAPHEAGTNSAALQISDALCNVLLLAFGGAAFAALGGGAMAHAATGTASGAHGSHPAAFAAVFLPMAAVALVGAWVTTRVRERRPAAGIGQKG
ncbi:MFS transporter [Streptomyces sp. SID14446]|uniref:MFS transporter n=1 Tax=Streptomyces sp. SID14446 TaxID=2706072 RepID=UPI0013B81C74|nr:MFS transporter [Streptomyces sp. SID14446]NEB34096.1 MFS transporter [Streptomyces sp. SID14446]